MAAARHGQPARLCRDLHGRCAMKIENSPLLDALCGEYLLGTLRGAARLRFERAQREEPRTALQLKHWQQVFAPRYSRLIEAQPSPKLWNRLDRELGPAGGSPPGAPTGPVILVGDLAT